MCLLAFVSRWKGWTGELSRIHIFHFLDGGGSVEVNSSVRGAYKDLFEALWGVSFFGDAPTEKKALVYWELTVAYLSYLRGQVSCLYDGGREGGCLQLAKKKGGTPEVCNGHLGETQIASDVTGPDILSGIGLPMSLFQGFWKLANVLNLLAYKTFFHRKKVMTRTRRSTLMCLWCWTCWLCSNDGNFRRFSQQQMHFPDPLKLCPENSLFSNQGDWFYI